MLRVRNEASWPAADFRAYLDAMMEQHGIPNDAGLARLAGIDASLISNWRSGKQQPSRRSLKKLAVPLQVPPVALYLIAGLDEQSDLELDAAPDVMSWPRQFHDLYAIYERLRELGRGDEALRSIARLVAGLKVDVDELESQGHPSGRRKAS